MTATQEFREPAVGVARNVPAQRLEHFKQAAAVFGEYGPAATGSPGVWDDQPVAQTAFGFLYQVPGPAVADLGRLRGFGQTAQAVDALEQPGQPGAEHALRSDYKPYPASHTYLGPTEEALLLKDDPE